MGEILKRYIMPHPPIILPEVGKGEESKIKATAAACYNIAVDIQKLQPDTIIVITPHGPVFRDAVALCSIDEIAGDMSMFNAPQVSFKLPINIELTESIVAEAKKENVQTIGLKKENYKAYQISDALDHGASIPLYFINKAYNDYKLVHITYGMLSNIDLYKFGISIQKAVESSNCKTVIIASGDLSHRLLENGPYGFNAEGPKFDKTVLNLLQKGDVKGIYSMDKSTINGAGECGLRSFYILTGTLEGYDFKGKLLSYEGTFGVGYGVMEIEASKASDRTFLQSLKDIKLQSNAASREAEDSYVKLARETLEFYVKTHNIIDMPSYVSSEMLNEKHGVFVSLKKDGELRGCIGTINPVTESCAEEIIRNAIEAGTGDPRFFPVDEEELPELVYSVDILMPPEKATKDMLDIKRYGVIVRKGRKAGLLLPDLEGVTSVEEQLEIALNKGGISPLEDYEIERFEVIRHGKK